MMDRHTIKREDVERWMAQEAWYTAASSYGKGSAKKIEMNNDDLFRVIDHDKEVYRGYDIAAAVKAYNHAD